MFNVIGAPWHGIVIENSESNYTKFKTEIDATEKSNEMEKKKYFNLL